MSQIDPIVSAKAPIRFNPFDNAKLSMETPFSDVFGITETVADIQDRLVVNLSFDGQDVTYVPGLRAGAQGQNFDRDWRWLTFITGFSGGMTANNNWWYSAQAAFNGVTPGHPSWNNFSWDTWVSSTCLRKWYEWGARKFHMHLPWGKTPQGLYGQTGYSTPRTQITAMIAAGLTLTPEPLKYVPDAYLLAKEGYVDPFTGATGNDPLPHLTDDIVDGKVQGFVPLFRALTSGSSAGLSQEIWERLTGIGGPSAWFNPNEPIEMVCYIGSMNTDSYWRFKQMAENKPIVHGGFNGINFQWGTGITAARERWRQSAQVIKDAGCRLAHDALVVAPGPTVGVNDMMIDDLKFIAGMWIGTDGITRDVRSGFNFGQPTLRQLAGYFPIDGVAQPHWYIPLRYPNNIWHTDPVRAAAEGKPSTTVYSWNQEDFTAYDVKGGTFGVTLDAAWWRYYQEYLLPTFGKQNIFVEATPATIQVNGVFHPNAYLGHPVISAEEFGRFNYGGVPNQPLGQITTQRQHYMGEHGNIEFRTSHEWDYGVWVGITGITQLDENGNFLNTTGFKPGVYWSLEKFGVVPGDPGYASGLPTLAPGEKYFRVMQTIPGYGRMNSDYYVIAQNLIQKPPHGKYIGSDPTKTVTQDKTKRMFMVTSLALKSGNPTVAEVDSALATFGLPSVANGGPDIWIRRFPTIRDFAKFVVPLKTATQPLNPEKTNFGAPENFIDIEELAKSIGVEVADMPRKDGIDPVMWIYTSSWDAFSGSKLSGSSGGQFYKPSIENDINQEKLEQFLDIKLKSWYDRYGMYPKYIAWNWPEMGSRNPTTGEPNSFDIERYFFSPATIPNPDLLDRLNSIPPEPADAPGVRQLAFANNVQTGETRIPYFFEEPGITWSVPGVDERFVSRGYDLGVRNVDASGAVSITSIHPDLADARDLALDFLRKMKTWRDRRGLDAKIGVYHVPFLPPYAYGVFRIVGAGAAATVVSADAGSWNDPIFPKGTTLNTPTEAKTGVLGWYTEEQTRKLKNAIKMEYRKRLEIIVRECEVMFPEIYLKARDKAYSDNEVDFWKESHRQTLELAWDIKRFKNWSTVIQSPTGVGTFWLGGSGGTGEIFPLLTRIQANAASYTDQDGEIVSLGDPITKRRGTLYDHDEVNYRLIDWIRDEYLRPVYKTGDRKVTGMSFWNAGWYQFINAARTGGSNYPGRETDRANLLKWLKAEYGAGATIDWNNRTDVRNKLKSFFDLDRITTKRYLQRFNKGIPRRDVVDPFSHDMFAATWNIGYNGVHPSVCDGVTITDVVPSLYAGWHPVNSLLRSPGNTGNLPEPYFTEFVNRTKKVRKGRRVVIPYYWHQDPIGDQTEKTNFYRTGTDGSTYTGKHYRSHETVGQVKFTTPWAYNQTEDSRQSVATWLYQSFATGAGFDHVAHDVESWAQFSLGNGKNAFDGPFGPTGMPAALLDPNQDGIQTVELFPGWSTIPDARQTGTVVKDSRFGTLQNPLTGLSYGGSVEKLYNILAANSSNIATIGFTVSVTPGTTVGDMMFPYFDESPTGISAATGPAWVANYGDFPPNEATQQQLYQINPFRRPWALAQNINVAPGKSVNSRVAWYAWDQTQKDLFAGDLMKRSWSDVLEGSTNESIRNATIGLYNFFPMNPQEGVFAFEGNRHPQFGGTYSHLYHSPYLYGEMAGSVLGGGYWLFPNSDYKKHHVEIDTNQDGVIKFSEGLTGSRSYLAMIMEMAKIRGIMRTDPSSWRKFIPWTTVPSERSFGHGWVDVDSSSTAVTVRTDPRYCKELYFHCMLSGAKHFNVYGFGDNGGAAGYTAGLAFVQEAFNEWKPQCEGKYVQPVSTVDGSTTTLQERIVMKDIGGNHPGATGVFISGAKILKYERGKTASAQFGAEQNNTYIWRVTAAPQGTELHRVKVPNSSDLPNYINLETGEVSMFRAMTNGEKAGSFSKFQQSVGGSVMEGTYSPGHLVILCSGTPSGNQVADSGAEIRHTNTSTPDSLVEQPYILGSGREARISGRIKRVGGAGFSPSYFPPDANAKAASICFGFFDQKTAQGLHQTGQNGNLFGFESAVCFFSLGGSVWQTLVTYKDPITGKYRSDNRALLTETSPGVFKYNAFTTRKFDVVVNPSGTEAKFYIDDELVHTVNSDTLFTDGLGTGGLPVGDRKGRGVWAGAATRDISLTTPGGVGAPTDPSGADGLLIEGGTLNASFRLVPNETDAQVTVSSPQKARGAWIKRKVKSSPPVYKIDPSNPVAGTLRGLLENGTGFPSTDPDSLFSEDPTPAPAQSDLTDFSDLRVIAGWKEDPIPYDPTPSGITFTVMAYHPSGIQKVEASLNGGRVATLTGTAGVPYGEFTFTVPPLSGTLPNTSASLGNLPKTAAGTITENLNQIRAKVFPFTGLTRILGGTPTETSRYYPPVSTSNPSVTKLDANETSMFIQNIDVGNDPGYVKLFVNNTSVDFPESGSFGNLRNALLYGFGVNAGNSSLGRNAGYLEVEIATIPGSKTIPCLGDAQVQFFPTLNNTNQNWIITNPERKSARIIATIAGVTLISDTTNSPGNGWQQTSYGVGGGFATPTDALAAISSNWVGTSSYSLTDNTAANKSYALTGGRIFRLNQNPLSFYNAARTGTVLTSPPITSTDSANWTFQSLVADWENGVNQSRVATFFGAGKVKISGVAFDKGRIPNIFLTNSNQSIQFENTRFFSSIIPSVDPACFVTNGQVSFLNCSTESGRTIGPIANAFGFSRYVIGCTANNIKGSVFSNASVVLNSYTTGGSKVEKINNPTVFGRVTQNSSADGRAKKNCIYKGIGGSTRFSDVVSLQRNNLGTQTNNVDHFDILYFGITLGGENGVADLLEGYCHNIQIDGLSMANGLVFTRDYRTGLANADPARFQKIYVKGSRARMIMNQGAVSGNELAASGFNYFNSFGYQGQSNNVFSITPRPANQIQMKIKGMPVRKSNVRQLQSGTEAGNTLTPIFFVTNPIGIRTFGLDMGGGFGPTANGFTQRGLTFATFSNPMNLDGTLLSARDQLRLHQSAMTPRLSWVYGINGFWFAFGLSSDQILTNPQTSYENGFTDVATGGNSVIYQAELSTFTSRANRSATMLYDANGSKHWVMSRSYSGAATDTWSNITRNDVINIFNTDPQQQHWLVRGTGIPWVTTASTNSLNIRGSTAPVFSRGTFVINHIGGLPANMAAALNSPSQGGITIEDQYGNLFTLTSFVSGPGGVTGLSGSWRYASGSCAGTSLMNPLVSQYFPREWSYNGDASVQYAPMKLEINLANTGLYSPLSGA